MIVDGVRLVADVDIDIDGDELDVALLKFGNSLDEKLTSDLLANFGRFLPRAQCDWYNKDWPYD